MPRILFTANFLKSHITRKMLTQMQINNDSVFRIENKIGFNRSNSISNTGDAVRVILGEGMDMIDVYPEQADRNSKKSISVSQTIE